MHRLFIPLLQIKTLRLREVNYLAEFSQQVRAKLDGNPKLALPVQDSFFVSYKKSQT